MNTSDLEQHSATSSNTSSTTSLPTPAGLDEDNVSWGYVQDVFQHPSLYDLLGLPAAIHTGVREYGFEGGRSPRISRRNRFDPYQISPGLRDETWRHDVIRPPGWSLGVTWEPGVNELSDVRWDTYGNAGCIGQDHFGTSVLTTDACFDTMFEEVENAERNSVWNLAGAGDFLRSWLGDVPGTGRQN